MVNSQNKKNKNLKTNILNIKKQTQPHNHKNEHTTTNRKRHTNRQHNTETDKKKEHIWSIDKTKNKNKEMFAHLSIFFHFFPNTTHKHTKKK